jgi:CRISPR system Cascade subunit CasB
MIRARRAAFHWWHELQPDGEGRGDRATLARLRRCATVTELMLEPATIVLFRRCAADEHRDLPPIALAAGVLAHVRDDDSIHPARRVGPKIEGKPDTALLKPLRFRALMEARTADEWLTAFRRLAALAENKALRVNILAEALLDWREDRAWTDERRRQWVFEYWDADPRPDTAAKTPTAKGPAA